jgi:anaerobic magnesium-protoporphyrin IX monomethyl ester cyclase
VILLYYPKLTKPKNRRFPLSIMALAAVLEGRESYEIVDGNLDPDPDATLVSLLNTHSVELIGVSVMPGPQMVSAMRSCRAIREKFPHVPIVWGGYFPSLYRDATLNAAYVDYAVRGQGDTTLLELIDGLRGTRSFSSIAGLSWKDSAGRRFHNPERGMQSPDEFPWIPYHRLPVASYLRPSYFGKRTGAHQASIGCPFQCTFCAVHEAFGSKQKMESPARTEAVLRHLVRDHGMDGVQFYDMNFFLNEAHTCELMERIAPLKLQWWCEGRIDAICRYSDRTLELIRKAGSTMIFFGAESGSNRTLEEMKKGITTEQTLSVAERLREFGIIPEFSFVIGNPRDPELDTHETIAFIRTIKRINPASEIIMQHYTPVPQRDTKMYGGIDGLVDFPSTPEEWATPRWYNFTVRVNPSMPWLKPHTRRLIDNFETVVATRWPTVQDIDASRLSRAVLSALGSWRYLTRIYNAPAELRLAQDWIRLRRPKEESI